MQEMQDYIFSLDTPCDALRKLVSKNTFDYSQIRALHLLHTQHTALKVSMEAKEKECKTLEANNQELQQYVHGYALLKQSMESLQAENTLLKQQLAEQRHRIAKIN